MTPAQALSASSAALDQYDASVRSLVESIGAECGADMIGLMIQCLKEGRPELVWNTAHPEARRLMLLWSIIGWSRAFIAIAEHNPEWENT